jgi:transposase
MGEGKACIKNLFIKKIPAAVICPQNVRHILGAFFMDKRVKYSIEQKVAVVRSINTGRSSIRGAARELGCGPSAIRRWLGQYNEYGVKGFKLRNGSYEKSFKLRVVRYYLKKGLSLSQTATYFKIPNAGIVCKWVESYKRLGATGLSNKPRGRKRSTMAKKLKKKEVTSNDPAAQKLVEMQKELEYLRAENAFLKKLEALVQQEEAAKAQARQQKSSVN